MTINELLLSKDTESQILGIELLRKHKDYSIYKKYKKRFNDNDFTIKSLVRTFRKDLSDTHIKSKIYRDVKLSTWAKFIAKILGDQIIEI